MKAHAVLYRKAELEEKWIRAQCTEEIQVQNLFLNQLLATQPVNSCLLHNQLSTPVASLLATPFHAYNDYNSLIPADSCLRITFFTSMSELQSSSDPKVLV